MKKSPSSSASLLPSSTLTSLIFSKSLLFPTSILAVVVSHLLLSSSSHRLTLSKVERRVMS
ncbi:hypothetical protein HanXRQr2_Chr04g0167891 [Helianthus annuus]|uniref:Uncharacterized protein n=1 Tax=Helianthus annuus TaxID=4232 RepID=A0A9K3NRD3_HELAN|nr:hypothetical protein HanXRQr2_Chr04g0167891 [Helianthus annuus]KAJ0588998.1 hypothetical protein HanIR_Chr04g0181121 [Helianthus annuus]KAJ0931429.1 hypothetical protein HanPSC8_Chr04g0161561 [Helianthus annuus]